MSRKSRLEVHIVGARGLMALINNAGILGCAPLELVSVETARQVFEVNILGTIAVTQAFLPLLRAARGRILNIGSLAGRTALPFTAPYCASKWALRALGDIWRLELKAQGIAVIAVEPGTVKTPIWGKGSGLAGEMFSRHAPALLALYPNFAKQSQKAGAMAQRRGVSPQKVARVIVQALEAPRPRPFYRIGREAPLLLALELLPTHWRDWLVARRFSL